MIGYYLHMKERSSIIWQKVNKTAISGNQLRVTNICPGLIYEFKVAAENAAGVGKMSKTSEEVLAIDACGKLFKLSLVLRKPTALNKRADTKEISTVASFSLDLCRAPSKRPHH